MSIEPMEGRRQACLRRIEAALDGVFADIERIASELERLWEGQAVQGKALLRRLVPTARAARRFGVDRTGARRPRAPAEYPR